jgi:pyridoxamine 5'-phosphate oxidase
MAEADPIALFQEWMAEATASGASMPDAMTLATAGADGRPSARMVLLRGVDEEGFRFYTNRESRKADQLAANPRAALVFHWQPPGRQVRIEGPVELLDDAASDAYFASRPRDSQLGAWASDQSRSLESWRALIDRLAEAEQRFHGEQVPRPPHWGGYLLRPEMIELWEHGEHRLHRRRAFTRGDNGWAEQLLAP